MDYNTGKYFGAASRILIKIEVVLRFENTLHELSVTALFRKHNGFPKTKKTKRPVLKTLVTKHIK